MSETKSFQFCLSQIKASRAIKKKINAKLVLFDICHNYSICVKLVNLSIGASPLPSKKSYLIMQVDIIMEEVKKDDTADEAGNY